MAVKRKIRRIGGVRLTARVNPRALAIARQAAQKALEGRAYSSVGSTTHVYRDPKTGVIHKITHASKTGQYSLEPVVMRDSKGKAVTFYRDSVTGSFTTVRSSNRIRETSIRAADSLRRLAKR